MLKKTFNFLIMSSLVFIFVGCNSDDIIPLPSFLVKKISKEDALKVKIDTYANEIEFKWKKSGHAQNLLGYTQLEINNGENIYVLISTITRTEYTIKCKKEEVESNRIKYNCEDEDSILNKSKTIYLKKENIILERSGDNSNDDTFKLGNLKSNLNGGYDFSY